VLVDTHCHLDLLDDAEAALERARAAGIGAAVTIGVDAATNEWAAAFARGRANVRATVGLHPHEAKHRTDELMARMRALASEPHVVAIGEAGLDYHYDNSPRDVQREVFAEQVRLAHETRRALVIHTREAWDDTFAILSDEGTPMRTVFHCFSGGPDEAARAVGVGAVLSFSGVVTFRNAERLRAAASATPLDRIVVETDAPFLTPVPHRGRRNEPSFVTLTADAIAAAKGVEPGAVAAATTANAAKLFGWPELDNLQV
jgi:TatD DNase family protein